MDVQYLERPNKNRLAYVYSPATEKNKSSPIVMFLGGYRSDMNGCKATYFEEKCRERGQGYIRLDYSGHGLSAGSFEDGTIGMWKDDALAILDHIIKDSVVLVGSSMGGWIALLIAQKRKKLIHGLVGIAAAPDFTEEIYSKILTPEQRKTLMNDGHVKIFNDYSDEPYIYTKVFHEEAKKHLFFDKGLDSDFAIRLIQGMRDKEVSWETTIKIQKALTSSNVDVIFIDDGDHRLSRSEDLELINKEIKNISKSF